MKNGIKQLRSYLLLWSTQSLSALGSSMSGYALGLWLYSSTGSALRTTRVPAGTLPEGLHSTLPPSVSTTDTAQTAPEEAA